MPIISFRRLVLVLLVCVVMGYLWSQESISLELQRYGRLLWPTSTGAASGGGKGEGEAIPVRVVTVQPRQFSVLLETLGMVESPATVTIKSRVDGQLLKAWFTEGALVHKGEPLFTLDDRTFAAQVRQAEANLAKDQAQLDKARLDLKRYADLAKQDVASKGQWESYQATVATLTATVAADQAQLDQARLLLSFTAIASPIDGVAGAVLVHPGNLVKNNDAGLVVIHQVQPIDVKFAVAEKFFLQLQALLRAGVAKVAIRLPDSEEVVEEGQISFINNMVEAATGTVQVKARAANQSGGLLPGQYVRIAVTLHLLENVLVLPSGAVQTGQQGTFVFVIAADERAESRFVKVLATQQGESAISGAVQAGDRVVVDGLRLTVGAKVVVREPVSAHETKTP